MIFKRNLLTKEEATQIAEAILATYRGSELTLLYDSIEEYKNCWALPYNNKLYAETRNPIYLSLGMVPILIDKRSGNARIYSPAGGDIVQAYDCDYSLGEDMWCLCIAGEIQNRAEIARRLQGALGLSNTETLEMESRVPGPLFHGGRVGLKWLSRALGKAKITSKIQRVTAESAKHLPWWGTSYGPTLREAYRLNEAFIFLGWHCRFRSHLCPIREIADRLPGSRLRTEPLFNEEACRQKNIAAYTSAINNGNARLVKNLLRYTSVEPDLPIPNEEGEPALFISARKGDVELVKVLLEQGANTSMRDRDQNTPQQVAEQSGFATVAETISAWETQRHAL